jgi:hypothetical protein
VSIDNPISDINLEKKDTHPLQNLITAPLQAIMDAQITTTETTLDYIYALSEAGTRKQANEMSKDKKAIKLKNVEFQLNRMEPNKEGEIAPKPYALQIPLITMIPIPYLSIKDAELRFNFKVVDVTKNTDDTEKTDVQNKGLIERNVIQTRYTSGKESSKETTSDISIKITVSQGEIPMGLAKFLTNANSSIIEKETKQI